MRPAICSGGRPVYDQTTPITGIRISGKMSVGVRSAASGPMIRINSASTTKVEGRPSAILTMAFMDALLDRSQIAVASRKPDLSRSDLQNPRRALLPLHEKACQSLHAY